MIDVAYTLVAEGSSDSSLLPILTWLIRDLRPDIEVQPYFPDLGELPKPPKTLAGKITAALDLSPQTHIVFVHRDADGPKRDTRVDEIADAVAATTPPIGIPHVCVVPVHEMEAWLLSDEDAIKMAAKQPPLKSSIPLPRTKSIEGIARPKEALHLLLTQAAGPANKRPDDFSPHKLAPTVAGLTTTFEPLRRLKAFQAMEAELKSVLANF